jgi:anti-sigma-K factor RskA
VAPLLALAASALFVVSVFRLRDTLQERNDARVALKDATANNTALAARLAQSDSLVAAMSGANVRVVDMASTRNMAPGARMFWDKVANRWTLVTHDLTPAREGRTYQLWLVTAKAEKISAGTFNTDAKGRAVVQATYALAEADLAAIAITEEPVGGSPQPTGAILIAGAATR